MIQYINADSSFFDNNKQFCQKVETYLATLNFNVEGLCTSYGYELTFTSNILGEKVLVIKITQTSISRGYIYHEISYEKTLLSEYPWIIAGSSLFYSLFTFRRFKKQLPKHTYFFSKSTVDDNTVAEISKLLSSYPKAKFIIRKQKFRVIINEKIENPIDIVLRIRESFL
jgi:transposase